MMEKKQLIALAESGLEKIIPHRSRMKLVDRLLEINTAHAVAQARVSNRWPLFTRNGAGCLIAIELVAQTSAGVFARKLDFDMEKEEVFGFIAGIKTARFHTMTFTEGDELTIHSHSPHFLDSNGVLYGVFDGRIMAGEQILAEISLQIIRPQIENPTEFNSKFQAPESFDHQTWDENWWPVHAIETVENGGIQARAEIPINSAWFDGHFPERPLLPGVAILGLVDQTLVQHQEQMGQSVNVIGFRKVRFKDMVLPGQHLNLSLKPSGRAEALDYRFAVSRDDKSICTGVLHAQTV